MNRIINIYTKVAAAVLAVTLAAGCVFEKDNPVNDAQLKSFMVQLGVTTDRGMTTTKASVEELEGIDGQGIENTIKTLRVYAYTGAQGSEKLCGYLYVKDVQGANSTTPKAYMMDIRLPYSQMDGKHNIIFKAVANAEAMMYPTADGSKRASEILNITELGRDGTGAFAFPGNLAFDTFDDILYDIPNQDFNATNGTVLGMPMYCVTGPIEIDLSQTMTNSSALNANDHLGHTPVKSVDINLTRSLAKIEVYAAEAAAKTASDQTTSVKITKVSLANIPTSGNLFNAPEEKDELDYGTGYTPVVTGDIAVKHKVNENSPEDIKTSGYYTKVMDAYYLAENNKGDEATYDYGAIDYTTGTGDAATKATVLKIDYNVGGTDKTGYVKMPQIKRNTWYKVLARITANGQMTLTLKVLPWTDTEPQIIDFADNVSLNGDITWSGNGTYAGSTFTYGSTNANAEATCGFIMDAPKGGTWYATLTGGDINSFVLETTVGETTTTGTTVSGPIVPGQQIAVKVRTTASNYLAGTKTVNLQITAKTADNRTLVVRHGTGAAAQDAYFTIVQPQN